MELVVVIRVAAVIIIMIIIDNDINMAWFISTELGFFQPLVFATFTTCTVVVVVWQV